MTKSQRRQHAALKPKHALGWLARLGQGLARSSTALSDNLTSVLSRRKLDEETLDELEEALIKADLGVSHGVAHPRGARRHAP